MKVKDLIELLNKQTNKVMGVQYVIFDGSSAYVVDEQDMLSITKSDRDAKVVFKSMNIDIAFAKADKLNEEI